MQHEAGNPRQVRCEIDAVCYGEPARALARQPSGACLDVTGFLDRKSVRNPQPILHITDFANCDFKSPKE